MIYIRRIERLREQLIRNRFDYLILQPGSNLTYFFGIRAETSERFFAAIVRVGDRPALIVPKVEEGIAESSWYDILSYSDEDGPKASLLSVFRRARSLRIAADGSFRLSDIKRVESYFGSLKLEDFSSDLLRIRAIKYDTEIRKIRKAARILQKALKKGREMIAPGITEKEVEASVREYIIKEGGECNSKCIVQFGPNTANPHLRPTDRRLKKGDVVLLDLWCSYQGYFADLTRTFSLSSENKFLKVLSVVRKAQEAVIKSARPEIRAGSLDLLARRVIEDEGFGSYLLHRTGHGLGLDIHEEPFIAKGNDLLLEKNMVFTVEPGIYLPNSFGVRLEDDVVIGEDGASMITDLPTE